MVLFIIHLSDIHFKIGENKLLQKKNKLFDALKNKARLSDAVIICVSGDVAYSGLKEEYKIADDFFTELIINLSEYTRKEINVFFVPGNHDCNFEVNKSVREGLLNNSKELDNAILDLYVSGQSEYRNFIEKLSSKPTFSNQIFSQYNIDFNSYSIQINSYNTAFCSKLKEQEGTMFFPLELLEQLPFENRANLTISMYHHKVNWQNANSSRKFVEHLEQTSDVALCGHEHFSKKSLFSDLEDNFLLYVDGGALQETNSDESSFNVLQFDLLNNKYRVEKCLWESNHYSNGIDDKVWLDCKNHLIDNNERLNFNSITNEWLNHIGANFTHPIKEILYLSDLFVFPNVRDLSYNNSEEFEEIISFEKVLKEIQSQKQIILIGDEKSGKTSLCKILMKDLYRKGLYPIYLKGRNISSSNSDSFLKEIKNSFNEQYKCKGHEFDQLSFDRIFLVIDNFDRSNLNLKFKNKLLAQITKEFENVIITGNNLLFIQELAGDDTTENTLTSYYQYQIQEFGHLLRYKLSKKWNTIARTEIIDEVELHKKNEHAEKIINSIIGPNFIPAYPIFLLTILQTVEAGNPHDLKESSYGHYYQVLILSSLMKVVKENDEIEKYYTYISELSFWFFNGKKTEISLDEFNKFHDYHFSQYKVRLSQEKIIEILSEASIIEIYDNTIGFRYPYIYYYFVAKYLADNLNNEEVKETIRYMCRKLHKINFANIILFLTHHSKDVFILNEIEQVAREQFLEYVPIKFEHDVESFNGMIDTIPNLAYQQTQIQEENKENILNQRDDLERNMPKNATEIEVAIDEEDELDFVSQLNGSFKTLEILGQVLKNHHASIKAQRKITFLKESYDIGLRTLSSVFKILESSDEYLISQINDYIDKHNIKKDKFKYENLGRKIIFNFGCHMTYSIIKKIVSSVGTNKLRDIYPEVLSENQMNSYKLIDFSIKIEHFNSFPMSELKKLSDDFKSNPLAYVTLRRTVYDYLYMYPLNVDKKQQISSILGISMSTQRAIDAKSKRKKR